MPPRGNLVTRLLANVGAAGAVISFSVFTPATTSAQTGRQFYVDDTSVSDSSSGTSSTEHVKARSTS